MRKSLQVYVINLKEKIKMKCILLEIMKISLKKKKSSKSSSMIYKRQQKKNTFFGIFFSILSDLFFLLIKVVYKI